MSKEQNVACFRPLTLRASGAEGGYALSR